MRDILEYVVSSLVSKPEAVRIDEQSSEGTVTFNLKVDPTDMGLIIGRSGQTIKALRKLLIARAMAESKDTRVFLNLVEKA